MSNHTTRGAVSAAAPRWSEQDEVAHIEDDFVKGEFEMKQCSTIEQALADDQIISDAFGTPSSAEDYSYCPNCHQLRWLGTCVECDFSNERPAQEASGAGR